jgi:hypothetical protein
MVFFNKSIPFTKYPVLLTLFVDFHEYSAFFRDIPIHFEFPLIDLDIFLQKLINLAFLGVSNIAVEL